MKKTLIALAMAASAVVSGSVIAADWEASGFGGTVEMRGTLTPPVKSVPWEVKVGASVNNLDADIKSGQKSVDFRLERVAPVLSIRNTSRDYVSFWGATPQISYDGALDLGAFNHGVATLTLPVSDGTSDIGQIKIPLTALATAAQLGGKTYSSLMAPSEGTLFYGGLPINGAAVFDGSDKMNEFDPEALVNFIPTGDVSAQGDIVVEESGKYSAVYVSAIDANQSVSINLDKPATTSITWKASLPITVSYL
ncbi:TPA: fimbrial protein [Escherichia coli]|nr:fimbrial protein [Escherichia coli]HAW0423208.1 fimbrial protein [Escherichia coli]